METEPRIDRSKLSPAPSWFSLGLLAGALVMYTVYPRLAGGSAPATPRAAGAPAATATVALAPAPTPTPTPIEPKLIGRTSAEEAEFVFRHYRGDAIWEQDRSEFALWNRDTQRFSEFFEVFRDDQGRLYFRSIPELTRPVIEYADEGGRPIRFTETEGQRERRLSNVPILFRPTPPKL